MTLLAPLALWALLALAIPVALHLRRRRVGRTIQVGTVRHLENLPTAERRGLRLREPWLLLLRAVILALLAILLARPVLDRHSESRGPFAAIDSSAPQALIDSLTPLATISIERIDDPWRRLQQLDDSLPSGVGIVLAASARSDRFEGPRPRVGRAVSWLALPDSSGSPTASLPVGGGSGPLTALQRKAISAAIAAADAEIGPLRDTAGWLERLPSWWQDSLDRAAFPVAVALALAPVRARPSPVILAASQLLPTRGATRDTSPARLDLHWWIWGLAAALFLFERWLTTRRAGIP